MDALHLHDVFIGMGNGNSEVHGSRFVIVWQANQLEINIFVDNNRIFTCHLNFVHVRRYVFVTRSQQGSDMQICQNYRHGYMYM